MDILERPFLYWALLELDENLIWPLTRRPLRDMVHYVRSASLISDEYMTGVLRGIIDEYGKSGPTHPGASEGDRGKS